MSAKTIEIKALLSADDYVEYEAERELADVKTSPLIRAFLKRWTAEQKHKRTQRQTEWPAHGQDMAMSLPGRVAPYELHLQHCGN
jgi:hypothetical protein